jgi:hypothetical protein
MAKKEAKTAKTAKKVAEMAVDANAGAVLVTATLKNIHQNPFRDMVMFPIDMITKVPSLVESMEKTGVWPSIIARPKDNTVNGQILDQEELIAYINSGSDLSDVVWEKCFGHHRQAAVSELGYDSMPIIPQIKTDEEMLLMMALENKDGFGANINSALETVKQVHKNLVGSIADFDDFDAYVEANGGVVANCFFTTSKQFNAAQKQVGFRTVKRFLGETWNERDVRAPFAVLKAVEDGLFMQEDIVSVPSMGLLEEISSIARVIMEGYTPQAKDAEKVEAPNWPMLFKNEAIEQVIARCSVSPDKANTTVTVAQLAKARQALQKEGVNPASYLRSGKGKTAFDVYEATKKMYLIDDVELEVNMSAIDGLKEVDGMSDYDGLEALQIKLRAAAERMAAGLPEDEETKTLDPTTEGDINKDLGDGGGGGEGGEGAGSADFSEVGDDTTPMPINQLGQAVAGDAEIMSARVTMLLARSDEFEADDNFKLALSTLLNQVADLAMKTIGKSALTDAFKAATE